jgi:hypothetical protein
MRQHHHERNEVACHHTAACLPPWAPTLSNRSR